MNIPECIGWALEEEKISTVKIFCEDRIKEEVAKFFEGNIAEKWEKACKKVEETFGDVVKTSVPINISVADFGICVSVETVAIKYCRGDYSDLQYGEEALVTSLKETKLKYPEVEYEGYIAVLWVNTYGSQLEQKDISSNGEIPDAYDFIGVALNRILKNEEHIWEREEEREVDELTFVVTGKLKYFENREEISEYIEDLGASVSGSISKNTSYLINNDVNSDSSKNLKAKELNIPVITEAEFIARFGEPDEYGVDVYDSVFWHELAHEFLSADADAYNYEEVIDVLYAHSEWIEKDVLRRAVFSLIDMATETDPDNKEILLEYVEELESGESEEDDD